MYILYLLVEHNPTKNFQALPRKKLFLKTRLEKSDLTKALIPYQPLDKARFGKNLVCSSSINTSKVEKSSKQCDLSTDSKDSAIPCLTLSNRLLNFVFLALLLCVTFFGCNAIIRQSIKCDFSSVAINPEFLEKHLQQNLFGQPIASHLIISELHELEITIENLSILILLGGSGTGKTWTTHLVCIFLFIAIKLYCMISCCLIFKQIKHFFFKPVPD